MIDFMRYSVTLIANRIGCASAYACRKRRVPRKGGAEERLPITPLCNATVRVQNEEQKRRRILVRKEARAEIGGRFNTKYRVISSPR